MKLGHMCRAKLGGGPHVELGPPVGLSVQPAAHVLVDGRPTLDSALDVEQCGPALAAIERLDDPDCSVASSSATAYVGPSPPAVSTASALHQLPAGVADFDLRAGATEPQDSDMQGPGQRMVVPLSAVCHRQPSQEDEMAAHRVLLLKKNPAIRREFSTA